MSNSSLFPVRAMAFAIQLSQIPEVVSKYTAQRTNKVLGDPEDGLTRMVLSSPALMNVFCKTHGVRDCRIRLAFTGESGYCRMNIPTVEVYSCDGDLISSTQVSDLDDLHAAVVCIEVQHVLLISKGIDLNMY